MKAEWQGLNLLAKIGGAKNKARERERKGGGRANLEVVGGGRVCFETALRQTKLFAERHDFDDEHKDLNDGAISQQASSIHMDMMAEG